MDLRKPRRQLLGFGPVSTPVDQRPPYRVFTEEFDQVIDARLLDQAIHPATADIRRNASAIYERSLAIAERWARDGAWAGNLTSLSSQPTAVTLLVDLSGSMRDAKIEHAAAAVKMAHGYLRQSGCAVEVLGFTTNGWQGGRARLKWREAGEPARPGRLCDLLHVIFCTADEDLADDQLMPMLRPDLLRENVDGEALLWAISRLRNRPEQRKLLLVLSDGAPVDDATLFHNHPEILEDHLLGVIRQIQGDSDLRLAALRVGFEAGWEIGAYYACSATARDLGRLGPVLMDLIHRALV